MPREAQNHARTNLGLSKKTKAVAHKTSLSLQSDTTTRNEPSKYTNYLVFVDDPNSRKPFRVLPANKISNIKLKEEIESAYLNNSRRKRTYDIAFTTLYQFTCRIFAKCEAHVKTTQLNQIIEALNQSYIALIDCNVSVEKAYETLVDQNARKVKNGVNYDTGKVNKRAKLLKFPDTASSYSEKSDSGERHQEDLERSEKNDNPEAEDDDHNISESDEESENAPDVSESFIYRICIPLRT